MLLEVNDLSISYGKGNPVVHGVSFSVDKGKILAIIGESGSGKTTVLRCRPYPAKAGTSDRRTHPF